MTKKMIAVAFIAAGTLLSTTTAVASAGTGGNPQLDSLCFSNPAFAAPTPNPVGLRKKNAYCTSGQFVSPPGYGSGPQ